MAGVDGCPGGWIAAVVETTRTDDATPVGVQWWVCRTAAEVIGLLDEPGLDALAIDIPVGLPEAGARECDLLARREISPRGCCVYPAPPREVVAENDFRRANDVSRALTGKGISKQAFFIADRIAAFDLIMTASLQRQVVECHPEVSFTLLAGEVLPSKKTQLGRDRRTDALAGWLPEVREALDRVPRPAKTTDALDALACAWTAWRMALGRAESLPPDPPTDAHGLRMQIVR